ncbi:MAG TPA: hypothetical protein PK339_06815 [Flavitalea sp.]|nr:hypothetical protein [Flavitalea sp.]
MANNQTLAKQVSAIGEEIGFELGNQMVKNFKADNQNQAEFYVIGRNILDQILAQPGCAGIRFYNAYNENGEQTMVYVGINQEGKNILEYTFVTVNGVLQNKDGIVADRIDRGTPPPKPRGGGISADDWNLDID